jgi:hypothetical protein
MEEETDVARMLRRALKLNLKGTRPMKHFRKKCTARYLKTQGREERAGKSMKMWEGRRD